MTTRVRETMDPSSNVIANKTTETNTAWITEETSIYIYLETKALEGHTNIYLTQIKSTFI